MYEVIRASREELEEKLVELFLESAERSIEDKGKFICGLAGGSSPAGVYRKLRDRFRRWNKSLFFPTDERYVSSDDPRSNYRFIRNSLGEQAHLYRVRTELPIKRACEEFGKVLEKEEKLDLIILGLGEDGHTASLFPDTECIACHENSCISLSPDGLKRISMSLEFINLSRETLFFVVGEKKLRALTSLLNGEPIPASRVKNERGIKVFTDLPL